MPEPGPQQPEDPISALLPQNIEEPAESAPERAPQAAREESTRRSEPEGEERVPHWLSARLRPLQRQRDDLREEVHVLRSRLAELEGTRQPQNAPIESVEERIAELRKMAEDDPSKVLEIADEIAQLRARSMIDNQLGRIDEAQMLQVQQMDWLGKALELWPEARDAQHPLGQLANARWNEEVAIMHNDLRQGRQTTSLAAAPNGRYRCIAEAAAELEAVRRREGGRMDGAEHRRREAAKRVAGLETGTTVGETVDHLKKARRVVRSTTDPHEANRARELLLDNLIPENLRNARF